MLSRYEESSQGNVLHGFEGRYLVRNLEVYDLTTMTPVAIHRNEYNESFVSLVTSMTTIRVKLAVVLAAAFKNLRVGIYMWSLLDVLYIDGNKTNIHPSNTVWKYPTDGLTNGCLPGFRGVPGFSRYQINASGVLYNGVLDRYMSSYTDESGYLMYGVTPDVGKRTIVGMHRLLALAFLPYGASVCDLDVNHINGIKADNRLDNLEWASRKGNCDHAYSSGLRTDNVAALVQNVFTGETVEAYSLEECARLIGVDGETVRVRCESKGQVAYVPGLLFKRKDDPTPWRLFDKPTREQLFSPGSPVPVVLTHVETGKEVTHASASAAGKALGLTGGAILYHLAKKGKPRVREWYISYPDFEELSLSTIAAMR